MQKLFVKLFAIWVLFATPLIAQPLPEACRNGPIDTALGFSPWPPDLSLDGIGRAYSFIAENGNIVAHHMDNGVPWVEALTGKRFPAHLRADWKDRLARTPDGAQVFLAFTPLDMDRTSLASYWSNRGDNQPLPSAWRDKAFDDSDVIAAYTNYVLRGVEVFKPDYLAIGIEANIMLAKAPDKWPAYLRLNAAAYRAVKAKYPDLPVFSTVQYEYLRGIEDESKGTAQMQIPAVRELLENSDLLALSTYRYGILHPNPPQANYFDVARKFGKPIAIAESGAMSRGVTVNGMLLPAFASTQADFVNMLLLNAEKLKFPFLINWVNIDYDGMLEKLPRDVQELAKAWVYTGLQSYSGKPKPALAIWRRCLGR